MLTKGRLIECRNNRKEEIQAKHTDYQTINVVERIPRIQSLRASPKADSLSHCDDCEGSQKAICRSSTHAGKTETAPRQTMLRHARGNTSEAAVQLFPTITGSGPRANGYSGSPTLTTLKPENRLQNPTERNCLLIKVKSFHF